MAEQPSRLNLAPLANFDCAAILRSVAGSRARLRAGALPTPPSKCCRINPYMYFHKYVISNNFKSIRMNTHRECRPKCFRLHTYEKRGGYPGTEPVKPALNSERRRSHTRLCIRQVTLMSHCEQSETMGFGENTFHLLQHLPGISTRKTLECARCFRYVHLP